MSDRGRAIGREAAAQDAQTAATNEALALAEREQRFRKICDDYGVEVEGTPRDSGGEDAQAYLDPDDPDYVLERWCVVSHAGEYTYLCCVASVEAAKRHAFANVESDIYAEAASRIVDLDTGVELVPDWSAVPWKLSGAVSP